VEDREGHDARRALDPGKSERELGFRPEIPFDRGLEETGRWILEACTLEFSSQTGANQR
jgi:dTDP-glucose 4,6-dehydratase